MGGRDKGLVEWRGRPLIAWSYEQVRPLTDDLILSCNRNAERYAAYADRLVGDEEADFPGPLAGIRAALSVARHPYLLVLPCDAPRIDRPLLQALRVAAASIPDAPVMARRNGFWEPLFCCIPTRLRDAFDQAWQGGERSPQRVMLPLGARALECPSEAPQLANFNTPEQLND
jgi:molybdopterin-guanine dinucleotide biosynthesis protein A